MLTAKTLLLKQTREAFSVNDEMSLLAALHTITQEEASWQPAPGLRTAEQIVRHLAWCKSWYCQQGFARPMLTIDENAHNIAEALQLLTAAHQTLTDCLESCPDDALNEPIPTQFHGESAAHFFWIMLMHDLWHAGQIKTRRRLCRQTAPSLFRNIDCLMFNVGDLPGALEFYRGKLGLPLVWKTDQGAGLRMGVSELVLNQGPPRPPETDIAVDSAPEAARRFVEAGGKIIAAPFDIKIGKCVVVADPWGNQLVLLDTTKGQLKTDAAGNVIP